MTYQPVAATIGLELVYTLDNQIVENTLYVRKDDPVVIDDLLIIADAAIEWWAADIAPTLSNRLTLQRVIGTDLSSATGPAVLDTGFLPASGGVNSDPVPNNCALCITFATALRGRSFRGRNYIPAIPEANVALNTVDSAVAEDLRAGYANFNSHLPDGFRHVVVSRTVNGVVQMPSALTNDVISYVLTDLTIDSQRRRLPGRGR